MDRYKVYEKIEPYTVRIDSEDGFGTGFLFAYNENKAIAAIATAAHVIDQAHEWRKPLKLTHYKSQKSIFVPHNDRVIWIDYSRDAATILIKAAMLPFPNTALPLLDATKFKKIGNEVSWVGFPFLEKESLCYFSGKISFFNKSSEAYLLDGVAINGVSGGPVFYELPRCQPEVIGIVSTYRSKPGLPGLLQASDVTSFHRHLNQIHDLDEAQRKENETQEQLDKESEAREEKGEESTD